MLCIQQTKPRLIMKELTIVAFFGMQNVLGIWGMQELEYPVVSGALEKTSLIFK